MEARQADAAGYFSLPWAGTFIEACGWVGCMIAAP